MLGLSDPADPPRRLLRVAAVASCPADTLAAMAVLRYGGNSVDAADAGAAMLAVVEPHSTDIGGSVFCLYAPGASR